MHTQFGVTNEVRQGAIGLADTKNPLLAIGRSMKPIAGDEPTAQNVKLTLAIDKTGGGSSKLRVTVKQYVNDETGTAGTPVEYIFDGVAGGSGSVTAVCATLGALITELRKIPGLSAYRMDGAADYPLTTDDFIDVAEKDIPTVGLLKTLYRDASEVLTSAVRLGVPQFMDSGFIQLIGLSGTLTGVTAGTVTITRDDDDESTAGETLIQSFAAAAAETKYLDYKVDEGIVLQGPILIEVVSSDLSAANLVARYISRNV